MKLKSDTISFETRGENHIIDITQKIEECIEKSTIKNGIVCIFVPGSTGALTTIEYEPGLLEDLPQMFEKIAPKKTKYSHHETWHDDNGHSHVRASLIGPSITMPIVDNKLVHGTWQQVVFLEFDTHPRKRTVYVQIIGE
ncbi:MAG: secondary thiamine-phosphate synthase enzyme YjbQ [Candidatus Thermoplasmatota archaeon]